MSEIKHDPSEYVRGIQQILVSDKKKIGFLFGAGSSLAKKEGRNSLTVPAIGLMTKTIVDEISEIDGKYKNALEEIEIELGKGKFNIETLLSNLEQKSIFIGKGKLNQLDQEEFKSLIKEIKVRVRKLVSVHKTDDKIVTKEIVNDLVHSDFANWIGQADRKFPIELFTTNYDFLFELGLENKEVPYYDGFCGSLRPFFHPESVEDISFLSKQTKLWKIHGSLGWHYDNDTEKILRVSPDDDDILIYPSTLKYKDSKKQPYESLLDRLTNFVKQDDSILITCGYSWGDEHINSRIISALKTNTTAHIICLFFDKYDKITAESNIVKIGQDNSKISIYGSKSAVIGCKLGNWVLKSEPSLDDTINLNLYFDEDFIIDSEIANQEIGSELWTGEGEFTLTDFGKLVTFLNSMVNDNEIKKMADKVIKQKK